MDTLLELLTEDRIAFVRDNDSDETYRVDRWDSGNKVLHAHDEDTGDTYQYDYKTLLTGDFTMFESVELDIAPMIREVSAA